MKSLHELVAVKICHDISGVLGAIHNGIELYQDADGDFKEQALTLAEGSAKDAIARIIFFRHALGTTKDNSNLKLEALQDICQNYLDYKRIPLSWQIAEENTLLTDGRILRLVFLLLLLSASIIIRADNITISIEQVSDNLYVEVILSGAKWNLPEETRDIIKSANPDRFDASVKNIEALLLRHHMVELGTLHIFETADELKVRAKIQSCA
jgi:histidine phosphotransferase ChpT